MTYQALFRGPTVSVLLALMLLPCSSRAANVNWIGANSTDFSAANNWSSNPSLPGTGDTGVFDVANSSNVSPTLAGTFSIGGLSFAGTSGFTLGGAGTLTISSTGIANTSSTTQSITLALALGSAGVSTSFTATSGILALSGAINTGANSSTVLTLTGGATGSISGVISGSGGVTKGNSSTWTLSGANTYTGVTTVTSGTLSINTLANSGVASAIGANSTIKLTGGTLDYTGTGSSTDRVIDLSGTSGTATLANNGTGAITFTSNLTATGAGSKTLVLSGSNSAANEIQGVIVNNSAGNTTAVTKNGAGLWILSGDNSFTGATTVSAGTLRATHANALGLGTLSIANGAFLELANNLSTNFARNTSLTGTVGITVDRTIAGAGVTHTLGALTLTGSNVALTVTQGSLVTSGAANLIVGAIGDGGGARSLTKAGTGNLILSAASTYTGATTITGGTLALGASGTIPASTLLTLNGGVLAQGTDFSRALGGTGVAFGTNGGGFAAYGAAINVAVTGTVTWGSTNFINGTGPLMFGSNIADNVVTWTSNFSLANAARTIQVVDNTSSNADYAAISGVISSSGTSGGFSKTGDGTLVLSNTANTYTGATAVSAGTLTVSKLANAGSNSSLGAPAAGQGTISLGSGTTSATLSYNGSSTDSTNRPIDLAGTTGGATLSQDGTGTVTFSTAFTATGAGSKTLTLAGANSNANTISGAIVDNSGANKTAVAKSGAGTWVLSGTNTFTGGLTVAAGALTLSGSISSSNALTINGGTLSLTNTSGQTVQSLSGSGGAISFGTNHTLTIAGASSTSYAGALNGTGSLGLTLSGGGVLTLSGGGTFTPSSGVGLLTVQSGSTLALGAGNGLPTNANLSINSGTLSLSGYAQSNTLGTLALGASGATIDFGAALTSSVVFGDSSGTGWSGGSLTITNYTQGSDSLRFGTSSAGLSPTQLAAITFTGYGTGANIDSLGFVTPSAIPEPATVAVMFGSTALGFAVYRRRRAAQKKVVVKAAF